MKTDIDYQKELIRLVDKINRLEDENFILNQKCTVYEYVLKYLLHANSWTHVLLSYLIDIETASTKTNFLLANEIIEMPLKIIKFITENIFEYEKKLKQKNRSIDFKISEPSFNLQEQNEKLIKLNKFVNQNLPKLKKNEKKFPESFHFLGHCFFCACYSVSRQLFCGKLYQNLYEG